MSDKKYPPSDLKIESLRSQGIVPISRDVNFFSILLGLVAFIIFFISYAAPEFSNLIEKSFSTTTNPIEQIWAILSVAVKYSLILLGIICVSVFVSVFLQTKFLFSLRALLPSFSNLWFSGEKISKKILFLLLSFFKLAVWIGIFALFCRYVFDSLLNIEFVLTSVEYDYASNVFLIFIIVALGFCILLSVLSRIAVVLAFKREHSMTREELIREQQETEVRPEIRAKQRELIQE